MRQAEDIRIQELKEGDPHLFIALAGESSHQVEPIFIVQFLLATFLITSKSFCVTRRSNSPKGCFSNMTRICSFLAGTHLRRISSRTSLNNGLGGSARFLFNSSLRWCSASFASLPPGSFKNSP